MLHLDSLLCSDYDSISLLLKDNPHLLDDSNNFWPLKCQRDFPDKPYFNFWPGHVNYLVQATPGFLLPIYFTNLDRSAKLPEYRVYRRLYEDHPDLSNILSLSRDGKDTSLHDFIRVSISKQFIAIRKLGPSCSIVGYFDTFGDAINRVALDSPSFSAREGPLYFVIVDLSFLSPFFVKYGDVSDEYHYINYMTTVGCNNPFFKVATFYVFYLGGLIRLNSYC